MGSRPTAVDLANAILLLKTVSKFAANDSPSADQLQACANVRLAYIEAAEKILEDDLTTNLAIGRYGAEYLRSLQKPHMGPIDETDELRYFTTSPPGTQGLPDQVYRKLSVLTHCNTGLAPHPICKVSFSTESNGIQFFGNIRPRHSTRHNSQSP
jgi:methylthioribose-1-phosphate isomerase